MKIKIPWAKPIFSGLEKKYVMDALESTWISGGPYVGRFEREFAENIKSKHVITTSNGTTALLLALLGLNISKGDEVIIPGFTFVAPANMVITTGATPVFVDVDRLTWCIDPLRIENAITKKTKAVMAVHLYGNVCDMDALRRVCRRRNLYLIEDVAEAAFSKYKGRWAGTLSDVGCFSFQATKTIAMGEGGAVVTDDKAIYKKMKTIRDHGMRQSKRYWHDMVGHNFRLPNLQAAIGCAQLEKINEIATKRQSVYRLYKSFLKGTPGITMQHFKKEVEPVVWAIAVKIDKDAFKGSRDFLMKKMLKAGIETRPGFYPFQAMPVYKQYVKEKLPVSEEVGADVISLPFFSQLTKKQIGYICTTLHSLRKQK